MTGRLVIPGQFMTTTIHQLERCHSLDRWYSWSSRLFNRWSTLFFRTDFGNKMDSDEAIHCILLKKICLTDILMFHKYFVIEHRSDQLYLTISTVISGDTNFFQVIMWRHGLGSGLVSLPTYFRRTGR